MSSFRGSSSPRDQICISYISWITGRFLYCWTTGEAHTPIFKISYINKSFIQDSPSGSLFTFDPLYSFLFSHLTGPRTLPNMNVQLFAKIPLQKPVGLVLVAQSYLTPWDPVDCSPSGSSVHGILQARILEWVATPPPGDLPDPGMEPGSPALQADSLLPAPPGKPSGGLSTLSLRWWLLPFWPPRNLPGQVQTGKLSLTPAVIILPFHFSRA